jgi:ssDNA-binding Zn-finger/Zn-ribbon topoisomerase 1
MAVILSGSCPLCGCALLQRRRRVDGAPFLGCTGYPACAYTCDYDALQRIYDANAQLQLEVAQLRAANDTTTLRRHLRALAFEFHPDRAGEMIKTHDVITAINALLDQMR